MEWVPEITLWLIAVSFAASFVACYLSALSGGGAGLILIPVLILSGLPYINGLACHKLAMGFIGTGSTWRYAKEDLIDWKAFWWIGLAGIPFVVAGTLLAAYLPGDVMKPAVGAIILVIAGYKIFHTSGEGGSAEPGPLDRRSVAIAALLLIPCAFYCGWISVAGGVFTTFIYVHCLKYNHLRAVAMTFATNGIFWNGVSAIVHIFMGHIVWALAPGLVIGAVLGSYAGACTGIKKGTIFIQRIFLGTAMVTAIILLWPVAVKILHHSGT